MFYQLEKVSGKFGAPLGRTVKHNFECDSAMIHIVPLTQGYDNGGAYWGDGENLYVAVGDDFIQFHRARNIQKAQEIFQYLFPDITFDINSVGEFLQGYADAALFSSSTDDDTPLDEKFGIGDFEPDTMKIFEEDCRKFLEKAASLLSYEQYEDAGRNFWYSRNGHGTGFFEGDFGDNSMELQKIAEEFGDVYLYAENERVYQG